MNPSSDEPVAPSPTYQTLLQNPSYGSGGLSLNLRASTTDPSLETYVTLHSKTNDIMLFLGIRWKQNSIEPRCTARKCCS